MGIKYFDVQSFIDANSILGLNLHDFKISEKILSEMKKGNIYFHKSFDVFNEKRYLKSFKDIGKAVENGFYTSAFEHFCQFGYIEILYGIRVWKRAEKVTIHSLEDIYHFQYPNVHFEELPAFNTVWYKETYPDVSSPLKHYLSEGWKKNFNPSYQFDVKKYVEIYPEVAQSGLEPFYYYLYYGRYKNQFPSRYDYQRQDCKKIIESELFLDDWVAWKYKKEFSSVDPLLYYCEGGYLKGLDPNPFFDSQWYKKRYKLDIGKNPLLHYIQEGWKIGYSPSPQFDSQHYLEMYSEVLHSGEEPLSHYLNEGKNLGYTNFLLTNEEIVYYPSEDLLSQNKVELFAYTRNTNMVQDTESTIHFIITDFHKLSSSHKMILDLIWQLEWEGCTVCLWVYDLVYHESCSKLYDDLVK